MCGSFLFHFVHYGSLIHLGKWFSMWFDANTIGDGIWLTHLSEAASQFWWACSQILFTMLMLSRCATLLIAGLPSNGVCRCLMMYTSSSPVTFSQQIGDPPSSTDFSKFLAVALMLQWGWKRSELPKSSLPHTMCGKTSNICANFKWHPTVICHLSLWIMDIMIPKFNSD